ERAPSAELRENQLDEDSLPPYPALDKVLVAYVEEDRSAEELSADGFDVDVVERAVALVDRAEYKRRQAPPGVRLRHKAFGRAGGTPLPNRWRGRRHRSSSPSRGNPGSPRGPPRWVDARPAQLRLRRAKPASAEGEDARPGERSSVSHVARG